jgi:RNA polymerase sigma-70 factor (ECF subfamily)
LVKQALENLTTEQRQVIELAYFSGLSHSEIAVRLGQPLGTVKTRVRVGMVRLRELLAPLATGVNSSASAMKEHAV